MSLWDRILDTINIGGASSSSDNYITSLRRDADSYAFVDVEVGVKNHKIQDIGALRHDGATFHRNSKADLLNFLSDIDFLCGHNIVHHDAKFLFGDKRQRWALVDTLYMSPLLFPERPYHRLVKDDKLMSDEMNNPVNDCEKARELLFDEIARWRGLSERRQRIYASLLADIDEFNGFMQMVGAETGSNNQIAELIREEYDGKICTNADIRRLARNILVDWLMLWP